MSSYNPGMVRYNSISKREKEETSSIRKYDYGTVSSNKGFLGGMKSNLTNEYEMRSGMKSVENKTEVNDGMSVNRQLIEEQNRRSKL